MDVIYEAWVGQDGRVKPRHDPSPRTFKALVSLKPHKHKRDDGEMVDVRATLSFLEAVPAHGAPLRKEPIDARDRLTITVGGQTITGPIVDVGLGTIDPTTLLPYRPTVYLG